jgi:hypothetical protein
MAHPVQAQEGLTWGCTLKKADVQIQQTGCEWKKKVSFKKSKT